MTTQVDKELARRHFSRAARTYDRWNQPQEEMADHLMTMICDGHSPKSILEIGCGTGTLTRRLMRAFPDARVTALDIAEGMIDVCRGKFSGTDQVGFMVADAEALCAPRRFDLVISNSCLQWMSDLSGTIHKLAGVLLPHGSLAFSSPVNGTLHELWSSYAAATDGAAAGHDMPGRKQYECALSEAGFQDVGVDQHTMVFSHNSAQQAIQSVREMGATRATRDNRRLTRAQLRRMTEHYEANYRSSDGGVTCSYSVIYARAWL